MCMCINIRTTFWHFFSRNCYIYKKRKTKISKSLYSYYGRIFIDFYLITTSSKIDHNCRRKQSIANCIIITLCSSNYKPSELIISPSAILLSPVLTSNLPLTLLNSTGIVKLNFNISVCSSSPSFVMFTETVACEAPGVNAAMSGSEVKSTPPPIAAAV